MNRVWDLPPAVRGAAWMLLAAFAYTATGATVRHLSGTYSVFEVAFVRSVIAVLMMTPAMMRMGLDEFKTTRLPLHAFRALLAYAGTMAWFYGVSVIPMSDYYALQFTMPLFTIAGAVLFLGERASARHWMAVCVGFVGALIVIRPGFQAVSLGVLAAVGAALSFASVNICVRVLSRTDNTAAIIVYANLMMMPMALVPAVPSWVTPGWTDLGILVAVGVFGTIAQFSITRAVSVADARVVQPFDFARLPFAAAVGWVVFNEPTDPWTWVGAIVIFAAGTYVLRLERKGDDL